MTAKAPRRQNARRQSAEARKLNFARYLYSWNEYHDRTTPLHHKRIAEWLDEMLGKGRQRILLLAFRGAGKSTVIGLFCAWLLTVQPDTRILTLSADEALARRMLRSARKAIEQHPDSGPIRPERPDQWSALRFTVAGSPHGRDASMLAAGLDSNITGARAEVVICDDVEVPKTSATRALREKLRERLGEIEFVLTPDGMQLYAGTPHAWDSIYGTGRPRGTGDGPAGDGPAGDGAAEGGGFLAGCERLELPVMDAAGAPAWPERFGRRHIERLRKRTGPVRFASQMMLQPADAEETRLDIGLIRPYEAELELRTANGEQLLLLGGRKIHSSTGWWDPAYGGEERRDASAIACVLTDADGHHYIHDVQYLRTGPRTGLETGPESGGDAEAIAQCRQVADFAVRNLLTAVTVEQNGIGAFLPGLLTGVLRESGIAVHKCHNHGQKAARILKAFDARLAAGVLHAHRDVLAGPFGAEIQDWRPVEGRKGRDDALDAVAGCLEAEPTLIHKTARYRPPAYNWRGTEGMHRVTME
ncbi:MAG: phage terminase large subunit [Rhodospirillaceae bacterium]|nr:phage terminase large subunit [Rhodospirillaceae bacterium]